MLHKKTDGVINFIEVQPGKKCVLLKTYFFEGNKVVMQLHPSEEEYVNNHPYCLHLWKPKSAIIPTPPS